MRNLKEVFSAGGVFDWIVHQKWGTISSGAGRRRGYLCKVFSTESYGGVAMGTQGGRRSFLSSLGGGGVIVASLVTGHGADAGEPQQIVPPGRVNSGKIYTGTSEGRPTVLEAIEDAIGKAIDKAKEGTNSTLVAWTFEKLTCESGGVADPHRDRYDPGAGPPPLRRTVCRGTAETSATTWLEVEAQVASIGVKWRDYSRTTSASSPWHRANRGGGLCGTFTQRCK